MSNYPPPGPPPPYGYPAPPAPGITFVPAPVMMPIYPPHLPPPTDPSNHPTYVTNHYYPHQQHMQPHMQPPNVEDDVDWVSTTPSQAVSHSGRAFVAGKEGWDGSPLWVIRAHLSGEFVPGKLAIKHKAAYVPHDGKEVPVHNFDVLLAKPHTVRWLPAGNGNVPPGAIPAGNTHTGEPLYIGRVSHRNSITPGKVHPSHGCLYICFSGSEISFKQYEVLCKIVG